MIQAQFEQLKKQRRLSHGGQTSHAKTARPLSKAKWIHLVLKSKRAKKEWSFLSFRNRIRIEKIIRAKGKKFAVKIDDYANVGNHLHLKIQIHNRLLFRKFLVSVTGLIAREVTGARKGKKIGRFWDGLAFTRVLSSTFEVLRLRGYFTANRLEAGKGEAARGAFLNLFNNWLKNLRTRAGPSSQSFANPIMNLWP